MHIPWHTTVYTMTVYTIAIFARHRHRVNVCPYLLHTMAFEVTTAPAASGGAPHCRLWRPMSPENSAKIALGEPHVWLPGTQPGYAVKFNRVEESGDGDLVLFEHCKRKHDRKLCRRVRDNFLVTVTKTVGGPHYMELVATSLRGRVVFRMSCLKEDTVTTSEFRLRLINQLVEDNIVAMQQTVHVVKPLHGKCVLKFPESRSCKRKR